MSKKAWDGRFEEEPSVFFEDFTESISFDHVLAPFDLKLNLSYAEALKEIGILTEKEFEAVKKGISELIEDLKEGKFSFKKEYEDVHMNIEKALYEKIGEVAYKIHTGKSRNDQVATDLRMYLMEKREDLKKQLLEFMEGIVSKAEEFFGIVMPGFTHLQHAQPVLFSHWLMAYYEMMRLHLERLEDMKKRLSLCPLGSAAFAGSGFPINRKKLARALGFSGITLNSVYAVSSRDFVLEFAFVLSLIMLDLSRLAEEMVLWITEEFAFIDLPDKFCSGSSIMPQKKNPDAAELTRGKAAVVIGNLVQLLTLIKNLPLSYNRDLQEDKPPIFSAINQTLACLRMMTLLVKGLKVKKEKMEEFLKTGYLLATEVADYLVLKGVPFRKAHHITGKIVLYAEKQGKALEELSLEEFRKFSELFEKDIYRWLTVEHALKRRKVVGGTAPSQVKKAISKAKKELKNWKD